MCSKLHRAEEVQIPRGFCVCYMQAEIYAESQNQAHSRDTACTLSDAPSLARWHRHEQKSAWLTASTAGIIPTMRPGMCSDQPCLRPQGPTPQSNMMDVCHVVFLHSCKLAQCIPADCPAHCQHSALSSSWWHAAAAAQRRGGSAG